MPTSDTNHRKPTPAAPRPGRPIHAPRARRDWGTPRDGRSPQLGLRDADVVRELTTLSR